jgi:two-component system chemotaxis sensor kinase CheA
VTLDQIEKIQLAALDYATFLGPPGEMSQARETADSQGGGAVLRVETAKIDDLLRDIDELKYLVRSIASRKGDVAVHDGLIRIAEVSERIGDAARAMRVVRIGDELSKLHRLVRDLSRKLGKEGVLDIIGGDLEIDRGIVDLLFDPLVI